MKEFLKPDWRKIVILIALFLPSSFIYFNFYWIGFPILFFENVREFCMAGKFCDSAPEYGFYPSYFIIDLVFWYLISCLIVSIYDKFRKVKKK